MGDNRLYRLFFIVSALLNVQCKSLESKRASTAPVNTPSKDEVEDSTEIATEYQGPQQEAGSASAENKKHIKEDVAPKKVKEPSAREAKKIAAENNSYQCPKSLSPNQINCSVFPEGCVYVPTTITQRPLIYFRGLIQGKPSKAPASTEHLFSPDGSYLLNDAANANGQMIFATHSHTTKLSEKTLHCLKEINRFDSVDVASHSAGYQGLSSSSSLLSGHVQHLYLLDNFYNTESVLASIAKINPRSCSGFYTNHKNRNGQSIASNAKNVQNKTSCELSQRNGHVSSVAPVLKEQSFHPIVDSTKSDAKDHRI